MPLQFSLVCDLLDECQRLCLARKPNKQAVIDWFSRNRCRIDSHDTDLSALLSTLLPEKRTDRVFCIQAPRLEKIIGRALMLGSSRVAELARYKQPGLGLDLADCVERILTTTPNPQYARHSDIAVEEIDDMLQALASRIRWSSPAVRSQTPRAQSDPDALAALYRRLGAREAKWLTRLILKDFQPLILDSSLVYGCCHPLLPFILKIYDDFAAAINVVRHIKGPMLPSSTRVCPTSRTALLSLKPQLGIKVGRQNWFKARSIKHCVNMSHGRMSVERKIDGEYCQIHIDTTGQSQRIQIFSKSGKDSTEDRKGLCGPIMESLRLGFSNSKIQKRCILEGELVVYSHLEQRILPFHKIRNHVARRGRFLNTEDDSPPKSWESLMIVYYDLLLLDDRSLLDVRHSERFRLLEQIVHSSKGRAELVPKQVIDFGHGFAVSELRKSFANVIMERGEGLVLKSDEPYFNFHHADQPFGGRCIKLKKEYVGNFGDVGDFAIVGAGFLASKARTYTISNLQWTHFYVGCLDNKEQVQRWNATPEFTVVSVVELNESQLETMLKFSNPLPVPLAENKATMLKIPKGIETGPPLTFAFCNPLVFDLRCFSFDRPGNTGFWTLRFPVVSKIHFDRDFSDTVSFDELQEMAKEATTAPALEDSQENLAWIARLEGADPRGLPIDAISQMTTTIQTPSPIKSTSATSERDPSASPATATRILQACTRLKRLGDSGYGQGHSVSATPQPPLMAPPMLPPPRGATSTNAVRYGLGKRSIAFPADLGPSNKRRKLSAPQAASATKVQNGPRRPLVDVDGNASQDPRMGCGLDGTMPSSLTRSPADDKRRTLDDELVDTETLRARENSLVSRSKDVREDTGSNTRASETKLSMENNRAPSGCPSVKPGDPIDVPPAGVEVGCSYSSTDCHMASFTILVPPTLLVESTEAAQLLKAHGVLEAATSVQEWIELARAGSPSIVASRRDRAQVLLVDSVEDSVEAESLLARAEEARRGLSRRQRDLITVYDWRVLRHVTILEDESITDKYYDGFHDAWRRWFCGII